jgi:hypothetical protein
MKKIIFVLLIVVLSSGCASYMVHQGAMNKIYARQYRAYQASNPNEPIQVFINGRVVGLAIDVTAWEVIKQDLPARVVAAVVDVGTGWVLLTEKGRDWAAETLLGVDFSEAHDGTVVIDGDGNVLTYSKDSSGTTSSSGSQTAPHGQSNFDADFIE